MADVRWLFDHLKTPLGLLHFLVSETGALRRVGWFDEADFGDGVVLVRDKDPFGIASTLSEYFGGNVEAIDSLKTAVPGTPFQQAVWKALRQIPAGSTASYADIAHKIRRPRASRAVGAANHVNPVGLVVPCHRVIGRNGTLTGYAAGLERKHWLLAHEAKHARSARGRQIALVP